MGHDSATVPVQANGRSSVGLPQVGVRHEGRWLVATLPAPEQILSWAVVGGGRAVSQHVAWYQVMDDELRPPVDAAEFFQARLAERGLEGAVGLLTSASLDRHAVVQRSYGGVAATAVVTVGMGNALCIGDEPGASGRIGTINILCRTSLPLSAEAGMEAMSLVTEARTAAVLDSGVLSRRSARPATGTGTDCIAVASPLARAGQRYAGKHTALGHVVGAAVFEAVAQSLAAWQLAQRQD